MATITRENIALLTDKVIVKLAKEDYLPAFEQSIKKYAKTANLPGFRKGMTKAAMLRSLLRRPGLVPMPSTSAFDRQDAAWKTSVLPPRLPRIAVEMGVTDYWWKYGCAAVVGIDSFGESAPAGVLFKSFGFTPENVAETVRAVLQRG